MLETFGETLNARFRGPDGALGGGGVFGRENAGPEVANWSVCVEANGKRGGAAVCAEKGREAFGPVGADKSAARLPYCIAGEGG